MNTLRLHSLCAIAIATSASVATADLGEFMVEAGTHPSDHVLDTAEIIFAEPGATVSLKLFLVDGETNTGVNGYQYMIPCAATPLGAADGSVDYVDPSMGMDSTREDFIFLGGALLVAPDFGNCPEGGIPIANSRWLATFIPLSDPRIVGTIPVYLGDFKFSVSVGTGGDHELQRQCVPADGCTLGGETILPDEDNSDDAFETLRKDAAIIRTTCTADEQGDNGSICTDDTCEASGSCRHVGRIYPDFPDGAFVMA